MNEIAANRLKQAMRNAEVEELEREAVAIGVAAVQVALAEPANEDQQRHLDAALDDAMDIVARHRWRMGQRLGHDDGKIVRRIHALLRELEA